MHPLASSPVHRFPAEIHIEGNDGAGGFEPADHVNGGLSRVFTQSQGDSRRVETGCRTVHVLRERVHADAVKRAVLSVVNNLRFSGMGAVFIVIEAQSRIGAVVIDKEIIADSVGNALYFLRNCPCHGMEAGSPRRCEVLKAAPTATFNSAPPTCF